VAAADALLIVPIDVARIPAGTTVHVVRLGVGDEAQERFELT
jgi:hypothetical protein